MNKPSIEPPMNSLERRAAENHRLMVYIDRISPRQRMAFLRRNAGTSLSELAIELGTTEKVASHLYSAAVKWLRKIEQREPARMKAATEIRQQIDALPPGRVRDVATMHFIDRLNYRQIGRRIGRCVNTVFRIIREFKESREGSKTKAERSEASRKFIWSQVEPNLHRLTELERSTLVLKHEGNSWSEIAQRLGRTESATKLNHYRATKKALAGEDPAKKELSLRISKLPYGVEREALRLRLIDGLTYGQIASKLHIPADSVWQTLVRAKATLGIVTPVHRTYLNKSLIDLPDDKYAELAEALVPNQRRVMLLRRQGRNLLEIAEEIGLSYSHTKRLSCRGSSNMLKQLFSNL
ncbi:MAG: sigma factor-like helix-turn-helix DNA-binding protein [Pirellulaceae bacterium]|nr:sigma factor-like helix-turn-helix DNA-binding protein [Pirellulaceae bacterium]